jgi:CRP-like cAMP-binding protein
MISCFQICFNFAFNFKLRRYTKGEFFGELALLNDNSHRSADAVVPADSPGGLCKLLSIQRGNFERILGRGLHSFTSRLNLGRFGHTSPCPPV